MLHLTTLGTLQIMLDQAPLPLSDRKARALLVYLAVQPEQQFTRAHLQTLLWSNSDLKRGRNSLRKVLSQLQKALPARTLQIERQTVSIGRRINFQIDLARLSDHPLQYTAPFLQGLDLSNADEWHEWLISFRERLDVDVLGRLKTLGRQALAQGAFADAIQLFEHALTLDAWREEFHRGLIEAHWRAGDRMAAFAQYERCRDILESELGVEPSAETEQLVARITAQSDGWLGNLPARDLSPLLGRSAELDEIGRMLTEENGRLLTLVGLGGSGKTRLAVAAARQQQANFADGVWFIDLAGVTADQVVSTIASTLGISLRGREHPRHRLLNALKSQQTLLILDNFETLLASDTRRQTIQFIQDLLRYAPQIKLLVTSRERLGIRSESLFPVPGLQNAAVALFEHHAQRVVPEFTLTDANRPTVESICAQVDGLPLAIELAAVWVRVLSAEAIADELNNSLALLEATEIDIPERQRSLLIILEHAVAQLSDGEQGVLYRLSLFRGTFSREAAAAVAGATLFTLTALIDRSLLYRADVGRFRLHESLRQYALRCLRQSADAADTLQTFATYHLSKLADKLPHLLTHAQQETVQRLSRDGENYLAAWRWALKAGEIDLLLQAERALFYWYRIPERYIELQSILTGALTQLAQRRSTSHPQEHILEARLKLRLAAIYADRAMLSTAEPLLDLAEIILADRGCVETLGLIEQIRGSIQQTRGQFDVAATHYQLALSHFSSAEFPFETVYSLSYLGYLGYQAEHYAAAQQAYEQVLALYQLVGDKSSEALTLYNLAFVQEQLGNQTRALELLDASYQLCADTNSFQRIITSIESLNVLLYMSQLPLPPNFEPSIQAWLAAAKADGDPLSESYALGRLGSLALRNGDIPTSITYFQQTSLAAKSLKLNWLEQMIDETLALLTAS